MKHFLYVFCNFLYVHFAMAQTDILEKKNSGCNKDYSCLTFPCQDDCKTLVMYTSDSDSITFTVITPAIKSGKYIAIGFSTQKKMFNASVVECVVLTSMQVEVYSSYNSPDTYKNERLQQINDVKVINAGVQDGSLLCKFSLPKKRIVKNIMFDLALPYYVLFAYGDVTPENGLIHHSARQYTQEPIHLSERKSLIIQATGRDIVKIKAHASLMIIAWVELTSIAIIVARYYKHMWPNTKIFKLLVWFQIHRALMLTNVFCTITGFILIFVANDGWKSTGDNPHNILGIITFILCLTQPIMALFRCKPDANKRYIFNWAHWAVGNCAHIFSVATIFLGFQLAVDYSNLKYFNGLMGAFVALHLGTQILLDANLCITSKERTVSNQDLHLQELSKIQNPSGMSLKPPGSRFKNFVLIMYIILITALGITLLSLININVN